jgi:hypothetical protein
MLDVTDPATFDRWCDTPAWDTRTLEEFAAAGGYPVFPPNRDERILAEARALAGLPPRRIAPTGNRGTR